MKLEFNKIESSQEVEKQFKAIVSRIREEANRLTELVEHRKISVPEYKRRMWEHLGISQHCLVEGVSYVLKH